MSDSKPVVEARGLSRTFGRGPSKRIAIEGIDLLIEAGELVAVFGPSGSGKSTLLGVVGGLDGGFEGSVRLRGRELRSMPDRELSRFRGRELGFVFQAFHLLDHLSVIENVMIPSRFNPQRDPAGAAIAALERVGLSDRARDTTANLSGGQRQRVAIARAIAHGPSLLLCDEPTGNLDDETARQIIELFVSLNREDGTTLLCATHDERIARVASRVIRLRDGRVDEKAEGGGDHADE